MILIQIPLVLEVLSILQLSVIEVNLVELCYFNFDLLKSRVLVLLNNLLLLLELLALTVVPLVSEINLLFLFSSDLVHFRSEFGFHLIDFLLFKFNVVL